MADFLMEIFTLRQRIARKLQEYKTRTRHRIIKGDIRGFNDLITSRSLTEDLGDVKPDLKRIYPERHSRKVDFNEGIGMYNVEFIGRIVMKDRLVTLSESNFFYPCDYMHIFDELIRKGHCPIGYNGLKLTLAKDYEKKSDKGKSFGVIERGILTGRLALDKRNGIDLSHDYSHIDITNVDLRIEINGEDCRNSWEYYEGLYKILRENKGKRKV